MRAAYQCLVTALKEVDRVAVAFSGGVDSALVAQAAIDAGIETIAITVVSPVFARWQRRQATAAANEIGIQHIIVNADVFPPVGQDRCYHCKLEMARLWTQTAAEHGFSIVADGVTIADLKDPSMPGAHAATEAGIWHPLAELELSGADIREMARYRGLSIWDAPSEACLASRLPPEETITREKLDRIEQAEDLLRSISPRVRVRCHGDIARIEVPPDAFEMVLQQRERIAARFIELGFRYVTLDLQGFRHGSMHP
ncbi:MAG: ATP-dependent sacrificial sulfur transferase LarE [Thermoplasmatota archaeon]